MVKRGKSNYRLWIELEVHSAREKLPGNVRQRVKRILDYWRVLYAVNDQEGWVWALGIYRRPPYQYENLPEIVSKFEE